MSRKQGNSGRAEQAIAEQPNARPTAHGSRPTAHGSRLTANDIWRGPGARVLELSQGIAGPYAARLLADFGADVIKVEPPGTGDRSRGGGPFRADLPDPEQSGRFLYLNYNKRAVTLDASSASAGALLLRLLAGADALLLDTPPPRAILPGLTLIELMRRLPRLVVCSVSVCGSGGPDPEGEPTDLTAYALGGMLYITGAAGREPVKHGLSQAQYLAGVQAAAATLAALRQARRTGAGQWVDIALQETVAGTLFPALNLYAYTGAEMQRSPATSGLLVSSSPMPTSDGYVMPSYAGFGHWESFAAFVGEPALAEERFLTPAGRIANATELDSLVGPRFAERSKHELFHEGQAWGFTFSAVQTPAEIARCPHLEARQFFVEYDHPVAGRVRVPGMVPQASGIDRAPHRPAPLLGQHNSEVYGGALGLSAAALTRLRGQGVI